MKQVRLMSLVVACGLSIHVSAETVQLEYDGFNILLDCDRRGAIQFDYTVTADTGSLPRRHSFSLDSDVEEACQQTSSKTYKQTGESYDRGHLVPANHLDHLPLGIHQSNFMTNVLPQARNMNRGAWLLTEEITECFRDQGDLRVIGGVIYGYDPHDDFFLESHGVATPDYYWKVLVAEDDAIAWIIPNRHQAKRRELDKYLISIRELEDVVGLELDVDNALKDIRPDQSWEKPAGCDLS
jgi:endonuclease G